MKKPREVRMRKMIFLIVSIVIVALLLITAITYVMFFKKRVCGDFECFQRAAEQCFRFDYINDDTAASWKYEILGKSGDDCQIRVTLLSAKEGELGMNQFIGEDMTCDLQGAITYPEKDLRVCHGQLKEDLLYVIITKLHTYIIENLGRVDESLQTV